MTAQAGDGRPAARPGASGWPRDGNVRAGLADRVYTHVKASILLGRALQPVEQIVGSWRGMIAARDAFNRIRYLLAAAPIAPVHIALPRPEGQVSTEQLSYLLPRTSRPSTASKYSP